MAARLVKRCACLLREATILAPVVAPVGRLRLASVAHRTLTFSATCPSSHFPGPLSGLVEKEQLSARCPEHQEVERLIEKATRPEELLELLSDSRCLQENHAALMLIQLSRLLSDKPEDRALLMQDARFQQLLHLVDSQISAVWHGTLVKLLRSLYALALPAACRELRSVEQEVRWRLRRLKYRQLAFLAESSATHMRESPELLAELLLHLERRWTEIDDGRTAVALMAKTGHLSEPLMNRLEDKCLELVERFGPDELRKVLVTLAAQNRRSVPLLRAVSYHLVQKPFPLTKGMLLDLAYAYGKLGFHQTQVLQRLAADLLPHVPSLTSGEVARGAKSFALLKWLSPPLFEALAQHVVDRAHTVTVPHLCNVLLAFAHLNFRPEREDKFFGLVHEKLGPKLRSLHPALQVDVVWALCVLQQVQGEALRAVLCPELHARFLASPQRTRAPSRSCCTSAPPPSWSTLSTRAPSCRPQTGHPGSWPVMGRPHPCRRNCGTPCGGCWGAPAGAASQWPRNAEVLLDTDGQFLPLRDFVAPHLSPPSGTQPLPPGAKRLAFLRWEFPNFSSRSRDLLGRFALARRHVRAAGFLVVDVPYYEWLELKSEWQKGAYLKDKMRKAVAEELAK
ncbi:FAST kinase domain-containing protein 4 isoform X3 [Leopardus geoffroyi]|uniref:FAST kinase domain-containing protein 4 isoform X3 n=1 Tax=Leopardus geoffroyi TaxID=46844 RepID=UPI001E2636E1|nr:FAST kinase domain-containing protein 4 isoform X3 [Leopardus geoffroyi]